MSKELDEKLVNILRETFGGVFADNYPLIFKEGLAQIKQAIADEGYTQGDNGTQVWNNEFMSKHNMMTGQEFYSRFEKELSKTLATGKSGILQTENTPILEAAKRAANLTEAPDLASEHKTSQKASSDV